MSYPHRKKPDYNSETQSQLTNYNSLFPLIYFDLSCIPNRKKKLHEILSRHTCKWNAAAVADHAFSVHSIVLHEETVVIDKEGNELVIV